MRTTATSSVPAAAVPFVLAIVALVGCGDSAKRAAVDVAALNASLAVREGALSERFGGLTPMELERARKFVSNGVAAGEKSVAEIPADDADALSAMATALGRFRNGCESLVTEAVEAANASSAARLAHERAFVSLKKANADLSRADISAFLDGFATDLREKDTLLSGWRKQRLEKMENRETATFPAFAAAEAERCAEWEDWAGKAAEVQRAILQEMLPRALEAASNMTTRAADAIREHEHATETIAKLRSVPADSALVAAARKQSLEIFDGVVADAIDAIFKWNGDERDFIDSSRDRAADCGCRAEALEKESAAFDDAHPGFLPRRNRQDAQTAAATANDQLQRILAAVKDFEDGMVRLQNEGSKLVEAVESAQKAADAIRTMTQVKEEILADGSAEIEALRLKVEKADATKLRKAIDEKRKTVQASLRETENELATVEQDFLAAKTKALADEKEAKWEAEKKRLRISLSDIKAALEKAPIPGHARPEPDAKTLLETATGLLDRMDSMAENELRVAVEKARADFKAIEANTKWTPGTRHPDRQHVFASTEDGKNVWDCDPGYVWVEPGSYNLDCYWSPGRRHPDHPHVSAGQLEGTWVPDPGYKARWNGDLDPAWTEGARHPTKPHVFAMEKERMWNADPGYWFDNPGENSDLVVSWRPGNRHPDHPHVSAGQTEGTWVPDPGYKARWSGDLDPVWTIGMRHPTRPHIFASRENGKDVWGCDPGYAWVQPNSHNLDCYWRPGRRHPDHPHVSAGQTEGTWVPDPGYKTRWNGDLDPVWTIGTRHPDRPHIFASRENGKDVWACDPGYVWVEPNSHNLNCYWSPGRRHPDHEGIESAQQEGKWALRPGWSWVHPGTSDLSARWIPGARYPGKPHIHASAEKWKWDADDGYEFVQPGTSNLDVVKKSGARQTPRRQPQSKPIYKRPISDFIPDY